MRKIIYINLAFLLIISGMFFFLAEAFVREKYNDEDQKAYMASIKSNQDMRKPKTAEELCLDYEKKKNDLLTKAENFKVKSEVEKRMLEIWKSVSLERSKASLILGTSLETIKNPTTTYFYVDYLSKNSWVVKENTDNFKVEMVDRKFTDEEIFNNLRQRFVYESGLGVVEGAEQVVNFKTCEDAVKVLVNGLDTKLIDGISFEIAGGDITMFTQEKNLYENDCTYTFLNLRTKEKTVRPQKCQF